MPKVISRNYGAVNFVPDEPFVFPAGSFQVEIPGIRPYKLFTLLEGPLSDRIVPTLLPHRRAGGGLTLLETFVLIAAARAVSAKRVFEFGTLFGSTTLNLALNVPDDGTVFTLDLDQHLAASAKQDINDAPLTEIHLAATSSLDFLGSPVERKITLLTGNSTIFDFSPWNESMELVFIDGGHDLATVKSDSENALRMARKNKPSCVLWHDYKNPHYSGLTYYLNQLSRQIRLVHVEDTMLCTWFNDPGDRIWQRLLVHGRSLRPGIGYPKPPAWSPSRPLSGPLIALSS